MDKASAEKRAVLRRLMELRAEHQASLGETPIVCPFHECNTAAPGVIEDEQLTRKSYDLVAHDALADGRITAADLRAQGLPTLLEESD